MLSTRLNQKPTENRPRRILPHHFILRYGGVWVTCISGPCKETFMKCRRHETQFSLGRNIGCWCWNIGCWCWRPKTSFFATGDIRGSCPIKILRCIPFLEFSNLVVCSTVTWLIRHPKLATRKSKLEDSGLNFTHLTIGICAMSSGVVDLIALLSSLSGELSQDENQDATKLALELCRALVTKLEQPQNVAVDLAFSVCNPFPASLLIAQLGS